jgi:hypothetical protein
MAARLAAALPRTAFLAVVLLLATATLTFAAQRKNTAPTSAQTAATPAAPELLVVPDVRGQAYVFAKGILEDGGFAWRVRGGVQGYAANMVAEQTPAPGVRVVDTGAPTIVLQLVRNPNYAQVGTPENAAPFHGSALRVPAAPKARHAVPTEEQAAKPTAKPKPSARRPRAFKVPTAPREPLDEISLPERARRLDSWLSHHRHPTRANVRAYLYQHAWIVTGAKFGWWHGEQALRILIRTDRRTQKLWGIGAKSEGVAKRALKLVQTRSR